jgi:hypothetical protein
VFVLHDTPPRTETGVQPVPIGTFRSETATPRRPAIRVWVAQGTEFQFSTSWQHCGALEGAGGVQLRLVFTVTGTQLMPTRLSADGISQVYHVHTAHNSLWSTSPH